jgi:hypothetical protein
MAETEAKSPRLSVRTIKDVSQLADKRRELEQFRHRHKIEWVLNREFYDGNQWSFWNKGWPNGGRLETDPFSNGDGPRYKVRLTVADLKEGVQHYVAQLTKNRPIITGTPDSGGERDRKAAQMGTALWDYWWTDKVLGQKLHTSLIDATTSQGYWFITWDGLSGKTLNYMVSPQGQPLVGPQWTDENLDIYRDELRSLAEQQGVEDADAFVKEFTKTVNVGDISVRPIPGENVLLDPVARSFEDAMYAIVVENMDPDEALARYPKLKGQDVGPDAVPGEESLQFTGQKSDDGNKKSVRRVYHMYVRRGPGSPRGRYVCWIESPNMILEDRDWYLPFDELPLVKFPGIENPKGSLDLPIMSAARPLAKEMNRTVSQVVEHKNLTLKPQTLAPTGSMPDRVTNEPGRTVFYNPVNGAIPQWRDIPSLPQYVFAHLGNIEQRLDRLFNRIPSQRDALPARIDAPGSIDLIHEAVSDQLSPVIQRLEGALVRAGMMMVKLAQVYYTEERLLKIKGENGAVQVKKFRNADLEGGFSFHAEAGSGLPRTRAGKQARIEFMLSNRLIDERAALRYLDTADMTGLLARSQAAEEQAYRTIEKLKKGEPLNPVAYNNAIQQAQAAMQDPTADVDGDGQPDDPQHKMQALQQAIEQAKVEPMPHEDPQVHLDVLTSYMSSLEFEGLDIQLKTAFMGRFDALMQRNVQIAQATAQMGAPVDRPKVTLQLKGTTSAPVAGEILRESGVQVSDEAVAEPPLETWVTDSIDKPDADSAGNDPLDQAEQMQTMQQSDQKHALDMAKSAHEVALAASKGRAAAAPDHTDARTEEAHQQKLRHAEEMHQARLAQAKRPPAKPSGGSK